MGHGAGEPIKGFGGVSQGGEILKELHERIQGVRATWLACLVSRGTF